MNILNKIAGSPVAIYLFLFALAVYILKNLKVNTIFDNSVSVDVELSESGSTISRAESISFADRFYISMANNGTVESEIYYILDSLGTQANFNKVYNSFGKRQYIPIVGEGWGVGLRYDLLFWLNNELTAEEKEYIKESFLSISIF